MRRISSGFLAAACVTAALHGQQPRLTEAEQSVVSLSMEQPQPSAYPVAMPAGVSLDVVPVLGNVFVIGGASSNVVVQTGPQGAFVVDSATAERSQELLKAIGALSPREISYIVNTSFDPDHFGGNEALGAAGWNPTQARPGLTGPGSRQGGRIGGGVRQQTGAVVFAHENTLNRMSTPMGDVSAVPFALWPTSTFFTPKKTLSFNGEGIELLHAPNAYTDGDVMVFFRGSDVIAAGDVINTLGYAPFDAQRGGSIAGVLSALNDIIDLAIPRFNQQGGTRIVPGHGRILNEADVVEYRDMTTIIHDRVKLAVDKGLTVEQLQAQRPTLDYDGLYSTPALTGERYVELIYQELKGKK